MISANHAVFLKHKDFLKHINITSLTYFFFNLQQNLKNKLFT